MLHIIWALINFALGICYLVAAFRVAKLLKEKLGLFMAIIFSLGMLSFGARDEAPPTNTSNQGVRHNSLVDGNQFTPGNKTIELENLGTSKLELMIYYRTNNTTGELIVDNALCQNIGVHGSTKWEPQSVLVVPTSDKNKLQYHVVGQLNWKLMGLTIYSQGKSFEGVVEVK